MTMPNYVRKTLGGGGIYRSLLVAAVILCGAYAARAALPSGYTELQYFSMSGNGAANNSSTPLKFWLDTGASIDRDSTLEIAFAYDKHADASLQSCLLWCEKSASTAFWAYTPSRNGHALTCVKNEYLELSYSLAEGTKHVFKMSGGALIVDGDRYATHSGTGRLGDNLVLFGSYLSRSDTVPTSRGYDGKFYYAKVWDGSNVEVMNLVPARRDSDGVVGAYDTVAGRFLENAGSGGSFTAGPSVSSFVVPSLPDIAEARSPADLAAAIESALVVSNLVTSEELAMVDDYSYTYDFDGRVCNVTVTGLGDYAGIEEHMFFSVGDIICSPSDYIYSMRIAPAADKVTTPLTNFPVLVRLSAAIPGFTYEICKRGELRFFLPDGTPLAHEIDFWNENGESSVWVNMPILTSNTTFRACWAFRPGLDILPSAPSRTWPEYIGVWHFSEASGSARDSSGNGYHTDAGGNTVSNLDAKVGIARNTSGTALLTGVTNLVDASAAKPITDIGKFTLSGWMHSTATIGNNQFPDLMRKGKWNGNGWFACFEASPVMFDGTGSGTTREIVELPVSVYQNWVYMTVVFNDTSCSIYENGAHVKTYAIDKVTNSTYDMRLALSLTGRIDEYRIQDGVQSAVYVSADYATQTDPGFLAYGQVQRGGGFCIIVR